MLKAYFFQLLNLKKILFGGVEESPAYQVIKKAQNRSSVTLHTSIHPYIHSIACVAGAKRGGGGGGGRRKV